MAVQRMRSAVFLLAGVLFAFMPTKTLKADPEDGCGTDCSCWENTCTAHCAQKGGIDEFLCEPKLGGGVHYICKCSKPA
jgi:hypothetical protein